MYASYVTASIFRRRPLPATSLLLAAAWLTAAPSALADAPAEPLVRLLRSAVRPSRPHPLADGSGRIPVSIPLPKGMSAESLGLLEVAPGIGARRLAPSELNAFAAAHPGISLHVSPPLRPLLDRSVKWIRAAEYRKETGADGEGVVVGIIDTGIDITHPDFRNDDGSTRIAWMMTLEAPRGVHLKEEPAYGCTDPDQQPCAVYDANDINAILKAKLPHTLHDAEGHGTHVAAIAAGNGGALGGEPSPYIGVAPKATLVVVNASLPEGGFADTDILNGARFIFDRARDMKMPAVVNMSLGGDFGAHDGTSDLERGLAELVGDDQPGRAIVAAAGNSGTVYRLTDRPDPLGIHTEVHVPEGADVRVPIRSESPEKGKGYAWITFRPGDEVSVGLEGPNGQVWVNLTEPGSDKGYDKDGVTAGVINNIVNGKAPLTADTNGAVVAWDGKWGEPGKMTEIAILLRGHGDAQLWLTAQGDLSSSFGLLFQKGIKQGTITVPGTSPSLLAVGCTINRLKWPLSDGSSVGISSIEGVPAVEDSMCTFSSAGPTPFGVPKPEILAPGGFVAAAMSVDADPRVQPHSLFNAPGCPEGEPNCYVVNDFYAVALGTSMSAPHVTGAIALLLQHNPNLTQAQITDILQAGARYPSGEVAKDDVGLTVRHNAQFGAGELDLMGALAALPLMEESGGQAPDLTKSWFVVSSDYARPDPTWPVWITVELRREDGSLASGLDGKLLELHIDGPGVVTQPRTKVRHGLFRFAVAGERGSGGQSMKVTLLYDGAKLGEHDFLIGRDVWAASGRIGAVGGCSAASAATSAGGYGLALVPLLAAAGALSARRRGRHKREFMISVMKKR